MNPVKTKTIELNLLLEAIHARYGYDFRTYARASLRRRVELYLSESGLDNYSALQHEILYNPDSFGKLLRRLTVNVTQMFRDPEFYRALRQFVLPELKLKPMVKIWHAGCATGEEAYSLAILLKEEGFYEKCCIYATDMDDASLSAAREGIYPAGLMKEYTLNYNRAGGSASFSDYYTAKYNLAVLKPELKKNILFTNHNLAVDSVFGEMDLIICRNVLIYFERELQDRVFKLFKDSLSKGGFLCLGSKETVRVSRYSGDFGDVAATMKIYRLSLP